MAEIKSAIELAMERTKSLVMDEEEKREFARRDLSERLKAVARRFLEGIIGREEFISEYEGVGGGKREKIGCLLGLLVEEFEASADKERLFDLMEVVGGQAGGRLAEDARALRDIFREELAASRASVRKSILERLSDMGIRGGSLEPNVEEWEEWKEAVGEAGRSLDRRVREWKDRAENASK
jgi:hypothetical protein